jgi:hypothetical protein
VTDKSQRVRRYHAATLASFHALLGSIGTDDPGELRRHHVQRRVSLTRVASLGEIFPEVDYAPESEPRESRGAALLRSLALPV